MNINCLFL